MCSGELEKHFLFSSLLPLPAPFIKPISILKAVRNPSVLRIVSHLTQCFPYSLVHPSLLNPAEGANPASESARGHPSLNEGPGVGPGCVQRQIWEGRA